jgi:hypothetical protein
MTSMSRHIQIYFILSLNLLLHPMPRRTNCRQYGVQLMRVQIWADSAEQPRVFVAKALPHTRQAFAKMGCQPDGPLGDLGRLVRAPLMMKRSR